MLQHPMIIRINAIGYPVQEEAGAVDIYGSEIMPGDQFVKDGNEIILMDNLERYLEEYYQFNFQMAE